MGKVIEFQSIYEDVELNPNNIVSQTELAIMGMRLLEKETLYSLLKTIHDSFETLGLNTRNGIKVFNNKGSIEVVNYIGGVFIYSTLNLPMTRKEDAMELYSESYQYRVDCIRKEVEHDTGTRKKHGKQCISNKAKQV